MRTAQPAPRRTAKTKNDGTRGGRLKFFEPSVARAARAWIGVDQKLLAACARVATRTLFKLEDDGWVTEASLEKILVAFEKCGVTISYDDSEQPIGMTFKRRQDQKQ